VNIRKIMGEAMRMDRPISRLGAFDSPAMMATYSMPAAANSV